MNILMKSSKLIPIARGLWQFEVLDFEVDNIAPLKPFCRLNWKKLQNPLPPTSFIPLYGNMKMSRTTKAERDRIMYKRDESFKEDSEGEKLAKKNITTVDT